MKDARVEATDSPKRSCNYGTPKRRVIRVRPEEPRLFFNQRPSINSSVHSLPHTPSLAAFCPLELYTSLYLFPIGTQRSAKWPPMRQRMSSCARPGLLSTPSPEYPKPARSTIANILSLIAASRNIRRYTVKLRITTLCTLSSYPPAKNDTINNSMAICISCGWQSSSRQWRRLRPMHGKDSV